MATIKLECSLSIVSMYLLKGIAPYITKLYTLTHNVDASQSLPKGQRPMAPENPFIYLGRMTLVMIFTLED